MALSPISPQELFVPPMPCHDEEEQEEPYHHHYHGHHLHTMVGRQVEIVFNEEAWKHSS